MTVFCIDLYNLALLFIMTILITYESLMKILVLVPKIVIRTIEITVQEIDKILQFPLFPLRRNTNSYLEADN